MQWLTIRTALRPPLCPYAVAEDEFVTDDLIGWLTRRAGVD
ncbi:hypothetical protein [Nocardiopsis valliformis]|nr:hypothetical protein [Nocardiopsis valliformis]